MNPVFRKSILATAVGALMLSPVWAGTEAGQADPTIQPGAAQIDGAGSDRATEQMAGQHPAIKGTRTDELFTKSAQDLEGKQVVDSRGDDIGTVRSVVSSRANPDELHAVISQGAEGTQGEEMVMSLDELRWQDDKLHASVVKDDLQNAETSYQADQYVEVEPADRPLSEFAAFEPVPRDATPDTQVTPDHPAQPGEQPAQSPEPPRAVE